MHGRDSHELSARLHSLSHIAHPTSGNWCGSSYVWVRCEVTRCTYKREPFALFSRFSPLPPPQQQKCESGCAVWSAPTDLTIRAFVTPHPLFGSPFCCFSHLLFILRAFVRRPPVHLLAYPPRTLSNPRRRCSIWTQT